MARKKACNKCPYDIPGETEVCKKYTGKGIHKNAVESREGKKARRLPFANWDRSVCKLK